MIYFSAVYEEERDENAPLVPENNKVLYPKLNQNLPFELPDVPKSEPKRSRPVLGPLSQNSVEKPDYSGRTKIHGFSDFPEDPTKADYDNGNGTCYVAKTETIPKPTTQKTLTPEEQLLAALSNSNT